MNNPFNLVNANGEADTRGVTLALPIDRVRNLLPVGLDLLPQHVTPKGTHPLIVLFQDMFRANFSVPTLFPGQTYREYCMGVPFACLSTGSITPGYPGPYFYMPRLYLDNPWPTVTGVVGWGFPKRLASIMVTADRFEITDYTGRRLTSLSWKPDPDRKYQPLGELILFEPSRAMLNQPLISRSPASFGPFFTLADFDRNWEVATLRPIETALEVDVEFVPGYPAGRYPASGWSPGIDQSVLGSYELRVPWRLSLPYPPLFRFR
jgi:hypothetical protein